jgi:tetratricopeptide (TPR) repeat protein
MLETIREFAVERLLETDDRDSLHRAHSVWFLDLAERARPHLESSDQATWLNRLEREDGNLRAALDRARERDDAELALRLVIALQMYWFIRGRIKEGCDQTLGVLAMPRSAVFPVLRADALNGIGLLARDGDEALSLRVSLESREIARNVGDRRREADAAANLGYLALQRRDLDEAQRFAEEVLSINRSLDNRQGIADATSVLALVAFQRNDLDTATRLNEESIALWEALDDDSALVWARTRLAPVLIQRGEHRRALSELEAALETARRLDFRWGLSWAFDGLALLAAALAVPHTGSLLASAGAAVRTAAGLIPSGAEQAEIDRLWSRLAEAIGSDAGTQGEAAPTRERVDEEIRALRTLIDRAPATPGTAR